MKTRMLDKHLLNVQSAPGLKQIWRSKVWFLGTETCSVRLCLPHLISSVCPPRHHPPVCDNQITAHTGWKPIRQRHSPPSLHGWVCRRLRTLPDDQASREIDVNGMWGQTQRPEGESLCEVVTLHSAVLTSFTSFPKVHQTAASMLFLVELCPSDLLILLLLSLPLCTSAQGRHLEETAQRSKEPFPAFSGTHGCCFLHPLHSSRMGYGTVSNSTTTGAKIKNTP